MEDAPELKEGLTKEVRYGWVINDLPPYFPPWASSPAAEEEVDAIIRGEQGDGGLKDRIKKVREVRWVTPWIRS